MTEFKAGDRVIRIRGMNSGMKKGDKGVVLHTSRHNYLCIKEFRGFMLHEPESFKLLISCHG